MTASATAIVLAAGSGARFGGHTPKQLLTFAGASVLAWSISAFQQAGAIDDIVVVTRPDLVATVHDEAARAGATKVSAVIAGGDTRDASTRAALGHLEHTSPDRKVLVHDAARPLVTPRLVDAVVTTLDTHRAAGPAVPAADTIWEVDDRQVSGVPDRSRLWCAQTPQGFHLGVLRSAHRAAEACRSDLPNPATDDCGVVARHLPHIAIAVIEGDPGNIKVTHRADLAVAEAILASRQDKIADQDRTPPA